MKTEPLEKRGNLPLQREDFVSDEAHAKYLNGIAGLVFMQFLHSRHSKSAIVPLSENADRKSGAGAEDLSLSRRNKGS